MTPGDHAYEGRLLNGICEGICEVWPGESEVLQGSIKTPVDSRISHGITQSSRQLHLSVDRSGARLAISHPSPLQNIECILPLLKEKTRRARLNSDAQEVVELTKILHGTLKQLLTGGCEHNVIDIEQQIGSLVPLSLIHI